jgi:hypothetical protein
LAKFRTSAFIVVKTVGIVSVLMAENTRILSLREIETTTGEQNGSSVRK